MHPALAVNLPVLFSHQECAGGVPDKVILLCRVGCRNGLRELGVTKRFTAARGAVWYHFLYSVRSQQSDHSQIWGGVDFDCE